MKFSKKRVSQKSKIDFVSNPGQALSAVGVKQGSNQHANQIISSNAKALRTSNNADLANDLKDRSSSVIVDRGS